MNDTAILLPILALVGWTFIILLVVPYRRFKAGMDRKVTEKDFRYGESERVPPHVSLANRNFMNLLEVPVLFYVVCLVYFVSGITAAAFVTLAWAYVATRVVHSLIHVTYNKVMHRLIAFVASNIIVVMMWSILLGALL